MKFLNKEELKYKPGDVVFVSRDRDRDDKKLLTIILDIIEKRIISSDYNGIVEKEYFIYKGYTSNNIITFNEYEIII